MGSQANLVGFHSGEQDMDTTIRIMLVSGDDADSQVIQRVLRDAPGVELVGQFANANRATCAIRQSSMDLTPDLVLVDVKAFTRDGLDSVFQLIQTLPSSKIAVFDPLDHDQGIAISLSLGSSLPLNPRRPQDRRRSEVDFSSHRRIAASLRSVIDGAAAPNRPTTGSANESLDKTCDSDDERILSERERDVLRLIAEGYVKKEIANQLDIRYATVDTYVSRIYEKLEVGNAAAAVNRSHQLGILPLEHQIPLTTLD
tara:strand:- start:143790 stop:144560 length:771 start_codon:yes stop_codon:yes gene_type:complete